MNKNNYINYIKKEYIVKNKLTVDYIDLDKPWGAYFALQESDTKKFAKLFFNNLTLDFSHPLKPKFLIVAPHKRLSWQYHHRRSELWKVLIGPIAISLSSNDYETAPKTYDCNELIHIPILTRHRLIGLNNWALVAEIWEHEQIDNPSTEEDIVRLQDDFSRTG